MKPENLKLGLSGKRKEIAPLKAIRYPDRWRESISGREEQFKEWRYIAMQVLQRNGGPFRVIAILDAVFLWEDCHILATNERLASEAGHCGTKTVQRDLSALEALGLIDRDIWWVDHGEKKVRGRRIRLSIPADVSGIHIR
jgi:hypothetical protein